MKNYNELAIKYLKKEKKRTLLTILGIIISIAMITAVFTIVDSTRNVMIKQTIKEEGSFHGLLEDVSVGDIAKLEKSIGVEKVGVQRKLGYGEISKIPMEKIKNDENLPNYRYIKIEEKDDSALELKNLELVEGRLPKNNKEIVLDEYSLAALDSNYSVGDDFKINLVSDMEYLYDDVRVENIGKKVYKIVGISKARFRYPYNYLTEGITKLERVEDKNKYTGIFTMDKIIGASDRVYEIGENLGIEENNIKTNYKLLRLSAESIDETFNLSLKYMVGFIILIIIICTIAVIYNSFNISVIERISEFGILRAIGMRKVEIINLVLIEALILLLIALPIGLISGFIAMEIVFRVIESIGSEIYMINNLSVNPSPMIIIFVTVLGVVTIFISALIPAIKASKVSPIEAIRNSKEIKNKIVNKKKNRRLLRRIFGFEGEIAYKNLSRNKSRFIITVFSMVISIVLFIVFSSFSDNIYKITKIDQQIEGEIFLRGGKDIDIKSLKEELRSMEGVKEVKGGQAFSGKSYVNDDNIKESDTNLWFLDNEDILNLESNLISGRIDLEEIKEKNGVLVIQNTKNKELDLNIDNIKLGDKIKIFEYKSGNIEEGFQEEYQVVGVLKDVEEFSDVVGNGFVNILSTTELMNNSNDINISSKLVLDLEEDADLVQLRKYLDIKELNNNFSYVDMTNIIREENIMNIILNIFLYGFVSLIALISSINIVNTISTNIILRTKEITILKAVGMSIKDIKKMIALESIYYSFYAMFFGSLIGIILSSILFRIMIGISRISYSIPIKGVIIAIMGTFIIALFSGIYPLRKINDKIIIENIRD